MNDEKLLATLCHALGLFVGFAGPLILWILKKDESELVNIHGKEAMNFHISYYIYFTVAGILSIILIGFLALLILIPAYYIFMIIAAVKANNGEQYRYPLIFRFIA